MVVALIEGVVKFAPVPKEVPPLADEYQLIVPPVAEADNTTVPVPYLDAGFVPVILAAVGTALSSKENPIV